MAMTVIGDFDFASMVGLARSTSAAMYSWWRPSDKNSMSCNWNEIKQGGLHR